MHKSQNPRSCERGAGIRAGVFSPPKSHRPAMPAEICLEPQRLFESVVGFASGGQFSPLAWGNKDRDVLYLDYTINFKQDDVHYATKDTLVWRDRGTVAGVRSFKPVYKEN